VPSPADLKGHLERFIAVNFPVQTESLWKQFVIRHWPLKALALTLAVVAWILFAYSPGTIQRTFVCPIEYRNVSSDLVLAENAPAEMRVTLSGTDPAFRLLDPATLKISIDLANSRAGSQTVAIKAAELNVPSNLSLYGIERNRIRVELRKRPPPANPVEPTAEKGAAS
jgi:YbbR domain-containing protein